MEFKMSDEARKELIQFRHDHSHHISVIESFITYCDRLELNEDGKKMLDLAEESIRTVLHSFRSIGSQQQ